MRMVTRLQINALLPLLIALLLAGGITLALQDGEQTLQQQSEVAAIGNHVFDLGLLIHRYIHQPQPQQWQQWRQRYPPLQARLETLAAVLPLQRALIDPIQQTLRDLDALFASLVVTQIPASEQGSEPILLSEISRTIGDLGRDTHQLQQQLGLALSHRLWRLGGVMLLLLLLIALSAFIALHRSSRQFTRSLQQLQRGAVAVGDGDLDYRVGLAGDDELAQLSDAFDSMTQRLRRTTVSRDALATEVEQRRRFERVLQRKSHQLERANGELKVFAYVASHDLKAPLRAVANLAQWVDEDAGPLLDEENRTRLRLLRGRVIRMDRLIDGLLTYSRTLNEDEDRAVEAVALEPLLTELIPELALPDGFHVELTPALPTLWARPLHLRQIFQNLILNAVHHHDHAHGQITITAEDSGSSWRVEVSDDGPGIPALYRERLFQMFATLQGASERDEERTGIGLALVKRLVLHYGGSVSIEDNQPRGARLRIEWPKQPPHHADGNSAP